jgi:hypothetical protein
VDSVPDPLLLRKSDSAENRTGTSGSVARSSATRPQWLSYGQPILKICNLQYRLLQ